MSCRNFEKRVQLHLDGVATAAESAAVEAHARECAACGRVLAQSRQLAGLLRGVPEQRVSDSFDQRLMAAVREQAPAAPPAAWWERFSLRWEWRLRVPALATAGSLAAVAALSLATPQLTGVRQTAQDQQERRSYISAAVERHSELERANPATDWDEVQASIDLSTGGVITE